MLVGSPAPVVLTPLTRKLAVLVGSWFEGDEEGQRRLDTDFYGAGLKWWTLVERCPDRYGWVGLLDDQAVGFVDVEVNGEQGGLAIYVRREFRGRRVGRELLRLAAAEGRRLGVAVLVGGVENDNIASVRAFSPPASGR